MKIVIDIPDFIYTEIRNITENTGIIEHNAKALYNAIYYGKPLPEHPGRLIDISEYEKYFNTAITYDDGNHNHAVYTNIIPTIIEADKESDSK